MRGLLDDGEPPARAVALVRETMERVPWPVEELLRTAELADRWNTRKVAEDVGRTANPALEAIWHDRHNPNRPIPVTTEDIVVRKDAADDVTINGTTFQGHRKGREVVLVDIDKLEQGFRKTPEGYQPPGSHDRQALRYGDILDVNAPARMLRMRTPDDFRQGHKVAALRDRGYKVIPVEVPEGQSAAFKKLRASAPTRKAVREEAGAEMVDARSWAEDIIGRGRAIERGVYTDMDQAVQEAASRGISTRRLGQTLNKHFGVGIRRSRFVARDNLGRLNSRIAAQKQQKIGLTFYRWLTADDERVRPEHKALHGVIRPWSRPHPTEGHPGDAHGCRCVAIPATEAEWTEQNKGRGTALRAVGTAALAIGVAAIGARVARRVVRAPIAPTVSPAAVPTPKPRAPVVPLRPAAAQQVAEEAGRLIPIRLGSPRAQRARANRAAFAYAHRLTTTIRNAQRQAGQAMSDYGVTFGAAVKAIRESATNSEIRDRLAALVGYGRVQRLPPSRQLPDRRSLRRRKKT